ncbi:sensor histidine kinase [Candidatus Saccharibacteria bacterium]|nr:sensor histidine kinase [Candidatus Saccharibacteria bacterium]
MNNLDFLQPDLSSIKHSIRDIDDSYSHEWDLMAELCQNAVDAVNMSPQNDGGLIRIEVDAQRRMIVVADNGIGIKSDELPKLLRPFSTNKQNDSTSIGEKGVGLTFVIFSGNNFEIRTSQTGGDGTVGIIKDAYTWKKSTGNDVLRLDLENVNEVEKGTSITISDVQECPLFDLTFEQLKYVLRTKTSLGSTEPIWGDERNIALELKFTDINGAVHIEQNLPFRYALPYENLPSNSTIDFDEFIRYASDAGRTDYDKRTKLRDKIIFKKGEFLHNNSRKIKFVAVFVPQRRTWNTLAASYSLVDTEGLEDIAWLDKYGYVLPSSGIYTSVKGMPTGITVDHPATGNAGYWENMFILFEDSNLRFDIGRKSLQGTQSAMIKRFSREVFNEISNSIVKYVAGDASLPSSLDREEILAEINTLPPISYSNTTFTKSPKDQEASVAAIFYECMGNGTISDIAPLTSAYKDRYDLVAKWGRKTVFIEFKSRLRNITKDFNDAQKMFDEMDCIVCWDVSENDAQELQNRLAIEIEPVVANPLSREVNIFPHATHRLKLNGFTKPVFVVDLKQLLDNLEN